MAAALRVLTGAAARKPHVRWPKRRAVSRAPQVAAATRQSSRAPRVAAATRLPWGTTPRKVGGKPVRAEDAGSVGSGVE